MAVGVSIRGLAQTLKKTLGGGSGNAADWWGTVQTLNTGPPPSVTCTVNGTASVVTCQYGNAYAYSGPAVGDVVFGRTDGQGDYWVTDSLCTVATSPQGLTPIGGVVLFPKAFTDPAWLLLNGGTFTDPPYTQLHTYLASLTLPNWTDRIPIGAGTLAALGVLAGASTHVMTLADLVAHTHLDSVHTHTGAAHAHGSAGGTQFVVQGSGWGGVAGAGMTYGSGTASVTPGAGGGNTAAAGGPAGSTTAFSILNPVVGAGFYVRGL